MFSIVRIFFFTFALSIKTAASLASGMSSQTPLPTLGAGQKIILLDRDGVINEDVGSPGVVRESQLELTPGAGFALGRLRRAGCKIALITNQSCVGKGLVTEDGLRSIHGRLREMLLEEDSDATFDHIFYCTSLKETNDHRMKPNPGMVEEALKLFGRDSDCGTGGGGPVLFVGDTLTDMEAAARGGVPTRILVETGYGRGIMGGEEAHGMYGTLGVINEIQYQAPSIVVATSRSGNSSVPSIFPFRYAKNFDSAVEWILATPMGVVAEN